MSRVRRVGIYVRISDDREGAGLGVQRQEDDCRALAARLGWRVIEIYDDNDLSAFSRKTKRKGYERMLADVADGHIDAIISWHTDRLHRQPKELESFIDLVNEHEVEVQTVRGGHIDLTTASGRMMARQLGIYARYESEIKSERIQSKVSQLVRDGKIHNGGCRPFGYTRLYQGEGPRRKIIGDVVNEEEAELIRDWAARALEGESLYSMVAEANQLGLLTSTGKPWSHQAMRLMLISGRIAGLKEHHREVVGKAAWDAIIDEDTHRKLRAKLIDPKRFTGGLRGARKYPLTGLVRCACKDQVDMDEDDRDQALLKMRPRLRKDGYGPIYICQLGQAGGGCTRSIKMQDTEDHITDLILMHLESVEAKTDDPQRAALEAKLLGYEGRLDELKEEYAEGEHSAKAYKGLVALLNEKIADTRANLARKELKRRVELSAEELKELWSKPGGPPLERKRSVYCGLIRMIVVHPAVQPYSIFNPGRLEIVWK